MPEALHQPSSGPVPQLEIGAYVDLRIVFAVGDGQAAAGADASDFGSHLTGKGFDGAAHLRQVFVIGSGTDVYVDARDFEVVAVSASDAVVEVLVPDSVFALLATGVRLLTVSVTKARVDTQGDGTAIHPLTVLIDHVRRAAVHVDVVLADQVQRFRVEDVGRVHDRRRLTRCGVAGGQGSADLAGGNRVDQRSMTPHPVDHGEVAVGLLRVADDVEAVERRQL